jgi:hypothetical protein
LHELVLASLAPSPEYVAYQKTNPGWDTLYDVVGLYVPFPLTDSDKPSWVALAHEDDAVAEDSTT